MIRLGLTGSIGMGKTTTALMFKQAGAAVYDADAVVHELYAPGGKAVGPVGAAFAGVVDAAGVDRGRLSALVKADPFALARLEAIVHPLVGQHRTRFLDEAERRRAAVVVLDIPLMFETGADALVEAVVVVSAPPAVQRQRVLSRPGMDEAKLDALLARQMPDAQKRARADFVIDTSRGLDQARAEVGHILTAVQQVGWRAPRS